MLESVCGRRKDQLVVSQVLLLKPVPSLLFLLSLNLSFFYCKVKFLAGQHALLQLISCSSDIPHFSLVREVKQP